MTCPCTCPCPERIHGAIASGRQQRPRAQGRRRSRARLVPGRGTGTFTGTGLYPLYLLASSARSFASCARARTEKPGVWRASSVATVGNGFARARISSSFSGGIDGEPRRSHGSYWYETGGPRSSRFSSQICARARVRRRRVLAGVHPDRVLRAGLDAEAAHDAAQLVDHELDRVLLDGDRRRTRPPRCRCTAPGRPSRTCSRRRSAGGRPRAARAGAGRGSPAGTATRSSGYWSVASQSRTRRASRARMSGFRSREKNRFRRKCFVTMPMPRIDLREVHRARGGRAAGSRAW